MNDLDPRTIGEIPEEYVENPDGSVDIDISSEETETAFSDNLAETLGSDVLAGIAGDYIELIQKDRDARKKRDEQYEEGIQRTGLGNDAPGGATFAGASKVVHPVLAEACVDFSSRAIKELFPPSGPVKADYVGNLTKQEIARGDRKTEYMNWQLTKQMPEYYDELEQLLSQMPLGGAQYLKLRPDVTKKRAVPEFLPVDEIILPYASTSFYTSQRVTHRQLITRKTFEERTDSGFYREVVLIETNSAPDQSSSALATDKVEGIAESGYNEDGLRAVLEIQCNLDLDDDNFSGGKNAPYIVHLDEHTEEVLALYRNWDEEDSTFAKLDWIVEFKFIPWRGAYGIGLPHLIGGLAAALTGALRALLDSAHINNAPSMLKLKSARGTPGSNTQVQLTQVTEIDCPPNTSDIRQVAMPMPFNPPSPVLFQLLGWLTDAARGVVTTAEEKISDAGANMPVGTTLALIEQGSKVFSAIHGRLHRSQTKVLEILSRINSKWLSEEEQVLKLGKVIATREDFLGSLGVLPASDPNIFSEAQRYAQLQALMQMSQDPSVQWNRGAIYKRMMKLMHVQQPDELLPLPPEPLTADPLSETEVALSGHPIKAEQDQDHFLHIDGHLKMIGSPLILNNPLIPGQALMGILAHIGDHIRMMIARELTGAAQGALAQGGLEEETAVVAVMPEVMNALNQKLQPVMQAIGTIQQEVQKRMPPPAQPPEVAAQIQIAQMDIQRKTQFDQATLQMKAQEQQLAQQTAAATEAAKQAQLQFENQMKQAAQQFEQFMLQQEQQLTARSEEMARQLQLVLNEQDNHQHQMTELLKNRDDNATTVAIEEMSKQMTQMTESFTPPVAGQGGPGPDMTPQLQNLQFMLDQMGKQQTNEALGEIMNGLRASIETMSRPKMIIRDTSGKAQGIQ